jgi:MarR family transcriptional regulator, organic hydroperoxide resistance regulator
MTRKPSLLQTELKQSKPFRSPSAEAAVALLRTADVVRRVIAAVVEPSGVTMQQYNVLRILRGAGNDGIPTLEIVGRLIEETPGITRLLDRLEAKKLVMRERCARDRRQVLCRITPPGLAMLERLDEPVAEVDQSVMEGLSARETRDLIALLEKVRIPHI